MLSHRSSCAGVLKILKEIVQVLSLANATADRRAFVDVVVPRTMAVTDAFEPVCVGQARPAGQHHGELTRAVLHVAVKSCSG